jgi:hypothetical protein
MLQFSYRVVALMLSPNDSRKRWDVAPFSMIKVPMVPKFDWQPLGGLAPYLAIKTEILAPFLE